MFHSWIFLPIRPAVEKKCSYKNKKQNPSKTCHWLQGVVFSDWAYWATMFSCKHLMIYTKSRWNAVTYKKFWEGCKVTQEAAMCSTCMLGSKFSCDVHSLLIFTSLFMQLLTATKITCSLQGQKTLWRSPDIWLQHLFQLALYSQFTFPTLPSFLCRVNTSI